MSLEYNNKINGDLYSCLNLLIQSTEEIENDEYTGVASIGPGGNTRGSRGRPLPKIRRA